MSNIYDLKAWKTLRANMLACEPMCVHCAARGIHKFASEVDHIVPISKGGDAFDPDNLQCLCESCHSRKTMVDRGITGGGCDASGLPLHKDHPWSS